MAQTSRQNNAIDVTIAANSLFSNIAIEHIWNTSENWSCRCVWTVQASAIRRECCEFRQQLSWSWFAGKQKTCRPKNFPIKWQMSNLMKCDRSSKRKRINAGCGWHILRKTDKCWLFLSAEELMKACGNYLKNCLLCKWRATAQIIGSHIKTWFPKFVIGLAKQERNESRDRIWTFALT